MLIGIDMLLLVVGAILYPTSINEGGLLGIVGDVIILLVYGYIALASPLRVDRVGAGVLNLGLVAGAVGALVLCFDLVSSYFVSRDAGASATSSLLSYGFLLVLLLAVAFVGAARTGRIISGLAASVWAIITVTLLWSFCEFAAFYLFGTSGAGAEFVRQEMQADFARSGSTDYPGFVMSDFFGAGFFHPLLLLIFAFLLGFAGAAAGRLVGRRLRPAANA